MSPILEDFNNRIEQYYLEQNVFRGKISMAIERYELEKILEPTGYNFDFFCKLVSKHWQDAEIESSINGKQYISAAALQVAAGFKSDEVDLPSDAQYTEYLFELLGSEITDATRKKFYYGLAKGNKPKQVLGNTKQDYLWKAVRSHFRRSWGVTLFLPPERLGRDRFIQYPKSHLLFRETELKNFACKIQEDHDINKLVESNGVASEAFGTWSDLRRYFSPSAKLRIHNEGLEWKHSLYVEQATRYLSRLTEEKLEAIIAEGDLTGVSKLRRLRANRSGYEPYFLEDDGDGGFELFRDNSTFDFIEREDWAKIFSEDITEMIFGVDAGKDDEVLYYLGPRPRASNENTSYVVLSLDSQVVKLSKFETTDELSAHTETYLDSSPKEKVPRVKLRAGLRTSREAVYFPGYGPELAHFETENLTEGDSGSNLLVHHFSKADQVYHPQSAMPGMWSAVLNGVTTRFSIDAFTPKIVPLPSRAFDLATFCYRRAAVPSQGGFYTEPRNLPKPHIDLLAGTRVEKEIAQEGLGPAVDLVGEPLAGRLHIATRPPLDGGKLGEAESSDSELGLFLDATYSSHTATWEPNSTGSTRQINEMLAACYPDAEAELGEKLYGALDQTLPLVVADRAQAVALAKTTGSSRTFVSSPFVHPSQVLQLHTHVIRYAKKAARRYDGNENRFVFVVVDLSLSDTPLVCLNVVAQRYGLCAEEDAPSEHELPPNLYLTFILSGPARKSLRALSADQCPVYFANGGWGQPQAGALRSYVPSGFFQKTSSHASADAS